MAKNNITLRFILPLLGVIVLVCVVLFVKGQTQQSMSQTSTVPVLIGSKEYQVELAITPAQQQQGLSDRDQLGSDGMVFVFAQAMQPTFWMKHMHFSLDFIWVRDQQVVEIMTDIPSPTPNTPLNELPTYRPSVMTDMMMEVPAGFVQREGIAVGDQFILK